MWLGTAILCVGVCCQNRPREPTGSIGDAVFQADRAPGHPEPDPINLAVVPST